MIARPGSQNGAATMTGYIQSEKTPRERFLEAVRAHPQMFVDLYELASKRDEETASVAGLATVELDDSVLV